MRSEPAVVQDAFNAVMNESGPTPFEPLHPEKLTWSVLLGRWVQFAQSAVAWPSEGEGERWRRSVPDIIQLQAVWFALGELADLPREQQSLGLDRAEVMIDRHATAIEGRWAGQPLPEGLDELIADARSALKKAQAEAEPSHTEPGEG